MSAPTTGAATGAAATPDLLALPAHVAEEDQVERLFATVLDRFGRLDILMNNVGMNLLTPSTVDADMAAWRKIIDTNLTGPYLCARQAARAMRPHKAGKIVTLSSVAGRRAAPGMGIYGVAKAGLEMLTRVLAVELAPTIHAAGEACGGLCRSEASSIICGGRPTGITGGAPGEYARQLLTRLMNSEG